MTTTSNIVLFNGGKYVPTATYEYRGNLGTVRLEPVDGNRKKQVVPIQFDFDGNWSLCVKDGTEWGFYKKGLDRVDESRIVFFVEGEKCVDYVFNYLGLPVISPMGSEWKSELIAKNLLELYAEIGQFEVCFLPDYDDTGIKKRDLVHECCELSGIAFSTISPHNYAPDIDAVFSGYDIADFIQQWGNDYVQKFNRMLNSRQYLQRQSKYDSGKIPDLEVLLIASILKFLPNTHNKLREEVDLIKVEYFDIYIEEFDILNVSLAKLSGANEYFLKIGESKYKQVIAAALNSPFICGDFKELRELIVSFNKRGVAKKTVLALHEYSRIGSDSSADLATSLHGMRHLQSESVLDLIKAKSVEIYNNGDLAEEVLFIKQIGALLKLNNREAERIYQEYSNPALPMLVRTASEINADTEVPERYIFKKLLLGSCVTLVVGEPGIGKTRTLYQMISNYIQGKDFLGRYIQCPRLKGNRDCLIINSDMPYIDFSAYSKDYFPGSVGDKVICLGHNSMSNGSKWLFKKEHKQLLEKVMDSRDIGLMLVDSYSSIHGEQFDENHPSARRAIDYFQEIASKYKCAIAVVHHGNKNGMGGVNKARGSSSIPGAASAVWDITLDDNQGYGDKTKRLVLSILKSRESCETIKYVCSEHVGIKMNEEQHRRDFAIGNYVNAIVDFIQQTACYERRFTREYITAYVQREVDKAAQSRPGANKLITPEYYNEALHILQWQGWINVTQESIEVLPR